MHCMTDLQFFCESLHTGLKLCDAKKRQKGVLQAYTEIKESKQKISNVNIGNVDPKWHHPHLGHLHIAETNPFL